MYGSSVVRTAVRLGLVRAEGWPEGPGAIAEQAPGDIWPPLTTYRSWLGRGWSGGG